MNQPAPHAGLSAERASLSPNVLPWIHKAALVIALAGGLYYIGAFVYVALSRIQYPFALEWLEGGSYAQVYRLLHGEALYARPDIQYVAMSHPPLYYYLSAGFASLMGLSYLPLRLVSLASALGCMGLIYVMCRREDTGRAAALLGAGLFAATYALSGAWFDLARIDMLSVFLLLLSISLLRNHAFGAFVAAGVVAGLATLTRQTNLIPVACLSLFLLLSDRRKALTFLFPFLITYGVTFLILNYAYGGWYQFFAFSLGFGADQYLSLSPASSVQTAVSFWTTSIMFALPITLLLIVAWFVISLRSGRDLGGLFLYAACAIGMVGASWYGMEVGGYKNELIPAYAVLSLLFGLSLHGLTSEVASNLTYRSGLLAACALQFLLLHYSLAGQIPTAADLRAGRDLVTRISAQAGSVYIPWHPDLAIMAGKEPFASWSPMYQLDNDSGTDSIYEAGRVKSEFSKAMEQQQFRLIILDQEVNWIWGHPERFYTTSYDPVFSDPNVFWPMTGWQTRPTIFMAPNGK